VKVKTLQGAIYSLNVPEGKNTLVHDFKVMTEKVADIPIDQMRLLYHGKVMSDEKTLADYNVEEGCTVLVMKRAAPAPAPAPAAAPNASSSSSSSSSAVPPQQQAQPQRLDGEPVLPNLFPQNNAAADTLNTILQQAFQQAFRTGSGVNVNVSLNTRTPAQQSGSAGSEQPSDGQQSNQNAPAQMQVRVMPITQEMQALMRDAYAQVSRPQQQQAQQSQQAQQQSQQQNGSSSQPMDILQQVLQSIAGARNAAERESGGPFDSPEDAAASQAAGSLFSSFLRDLSHEVDSNPNGTVTDFLEREFNSMRDSDSSDSESEEDSDEGSSSHENSLDRVMKDIYSKMSINELMGMASHSEQSYLKLISVAREALLKDIGAGDHPSQEVVDAYADKVLSELTQSINEESLPPEVRERLKDGASLPKTFCDNAREPLRDFCRLLTSSDLPAQILPRIIDWSHSSLVNIVDNVAAVLKGSIDDVEVIMRYFIYTNSFNDVGRDLAYSLATVFSQNVMARYHHFKAQMLEATRSSSSSSSSSAAAAAVPQFEIPYDASILVPMPSVNTLVNTLLQRANNDTIAVDIPLSDIYRSGSIQNHA